MGNLVCWCKYSIQKKSVCRLFVRCVFWSLLAQLSWTFFLQNTEGWPEVSDKKPATNSKVLSISQTITALDTLGTQEINQNPFTIVAEKLGVNSIELIQNRFLTSDVTIKRIGAKKLDTRKSWKMGWKILVSGPAKTNQLATDHPPPSLLQPSPSSRSISHVV